MEKLKTGIYQHAKTGKFYNVMGVAVHSETREEKNTTIYISGRKIKDYR